MKTTTIIMMLMVAFSAIAQNRFSVMMDSGGNVVAPSKDSFVRSNILSHVGIARTVLHPYDLFNTAPMRVSESVIAVDAETFGSGGAALFVHDAGSSDPTNTTTTIQALTGRWVTRTVYSSAPSFAQITSKPSTLSGYGITNALPLTAGSNSALSGDLYLPAFVMNGVRYTNVSSTSGGVGGLVVSGDTNLVTNIVASLDTSAVRTGGTFAIVISSLNGSGDVVRKNGGTISNATLLGNVTLSSVDVATLTATLFTATNANLVTPRIIDLTSGTIDVTNSMRLRSATASRIAEFDASGFITNAAATTGTGSVVRAGSPVLTSPDVGSQPDGTSNTIAASTAFVRRAVDALTGAPGTISANNSGSNTNIASTDTVAASGSGGSISLTTSFPQVTLITNPGTGTYTVPAGARLVTFLGWAGGGGGGSGRRGLTNTVVCGGGGGGGGAGGKYSFPADILGGSVAWTNGAGGTGGGSVTTTSSNGTNGVTGGNTSFGNWVTLSGGGGGGGGTATAGTAGTAGASYAMWPGLGGAAASASGAGGGAAVDGNASPYFVGQLLAAGGGAGGGITTAGVASAGSRGGISALWLAVSKSNQGYGNQGNINSSGQNAYNANAGLVSPGSGAGGGGSSLTNNAGSGGIGGNYGGGGGGGGAGADTGGNSGAGGNGANGAILIIAE